MAKIAVNYEVVAAKSDSLKSIANQISTLTNEMKNEINRLRSAWEGDAAETLVTRFNSLSETFEERFNTVTQYSNFLRNASEEMRRTEAAAKQGASAQAGRS